MEVDYIFDSSEPMEETLFDYFNNNKLDPDVRKTAEISAKNNSTLPLIKLQLKFKLQLKRHQNGESLELERKPQPKYQMSSLEIERRKEMKNRNRIAAKKYRDKQRVEKAGVEKILEELKKRNLELQMYQQECMLIMENLKTKGIHLIKEELHP